MKNWLNKENIYIESKYEDSKTFAIHIDKSKLTKLAKNDEVEWMSLYGEPDFPDLDGSRENNE